MNSILIVGAGLYGLTVAERAASAGHTVTIIDKRPHVGGNAWSYPDPDTGIEIHAYGSHIFHTSNRHIWDYVNRFTTWVPYEHRVWTQRNGRVYPMPVTLATVNAVYSAAWSPQEAKHVIEGEKQPGDESTLEGRALAAVGERLYDTLIKHYTAKQWQTPASDLPASVINRLPIRWSYDTRYFNDKYQALPVNGYGKWCETIAASSPRITVQLDTPHTGAHRDAADVLLWTGPVDEYFGYQHGRLGWRTLDFELEHHPIPDWQGCPVMNNADPDTPWTRTHEFKHYPPKVESDSTVIMREYSRHAGPNDDRYYPLNTTRDREALSRYAEAAAREQRVVFGGRLGSYRYLDMHAAIGAALNQWETTIQPMMEGT